MRFVGNEVLYGSTSRNLKVVPKAYLTVPTIPSTVTHGAAFTPWGYLSPKHTAGTYPVVVQCYRRERQTNGTYKYVLRLSKQAMAYDNTVGSTTYRASGVVLPTAGTWGVRAYHAADSANATTYTSFKYFTVN
jgi:hypothetical protein